MKIALLGYAGSVHLVKLANFLAIKGFDVSVISQHSPLSSYDSTIKIYRLPITGKLGYRLNVFSLKRLLSTIKPDVLHTNFASGYGTLGRKSGFLPNILSVWGSDIYIFPNKNAFTKNILKKNLLSATAILSTSEDMVKNTEIICGRKPVITNFGIDLKAFKDLHRKRKPVIVTIRSLQHIYGIDILIKAFSIFIKKRKEDIRLVIVGDGPQKEYLIKLAHDLGVNKKIEFMGRVEHDKIPEILAEAKIFAALSRSESYCVAALEAQACGVPVIATSVGGLPEVVKQGMTGMLIPPENPEAAADAFNTLFEDEALYSSMANNAALFVKDNFDEGLCFEKIVDEYKKIYMSRL